MARFLTGLFGSSKQTSPPATSLRVNTSLQGVPIPLMLGGANRVAGNIIDYFNFYYQNAPASGGGKGGITGGGKGQNGNYDYFVSIVVALGEGPIQQLNSFWIGGTPANVPDVEGIQGGWNNFLYECELFLGSYTQTPWSFTESLESVLLPLLSGGNPQIGASSHALAYRGLAYTAFANFPLGSSASLPNFTFEAVTTNSYNVIPGQPDGDVSIALTAFLTNPYWGLGFPNFRLGSLAQWQSYCVALGFGVNPVIASSTAASSIVNDLTEATNSAPCWQDGQFTVIPYGDAAVTAGQVQAITETHEVPANQSGTDSLGNPLYFPAIAVSFFATFAGDVGVSYASGGALTRVSTYAPTGYPNSGFPEPGQYYEQGGVYYFSPADINASVLVSYDYAATASYLPNTTAIYDFTIDDFMPNQGTIGTGLAVNNSPVIVVRQSRDQMLNDVKVEYLDRSNAYNPVDIEIKDEASIISFGRTRPSDVKQFHFFCLAGPAQQSAMLQLIRQQVPRTFQFTVGRHFMLILELMALATVTDPGQGLDEQPVRIIEIQENEDFSLTITCEEYLGTVSAPAYGTQPPQGALINYNINPGPVNAPIIFEPTDELNNTNSLGSLQIWGAVSGQDIATWGGCFVWVSYDGENYSKVGQIIGPSRMGVTTADFPAVTPDPTGQQTIDASNTLSVDLSESAGSLSSATQADAIALNTASYVGGEVISYATAALTAANKYNLSYLVRGAYGTEGEIVDHPAGTPFARLDDNIFAFDYDQSRISATIYLKFQSFNIYQGGQQSLADCAAYPYAITGVAISSPLPSVQNLRTVFDVNSGFTELDWDDITDFRAFKYEVRSGASFSSALSLGQVAHPPFRVPGNGTYWVAAVAQPVSGLTVYSETWEDVAVSGAVITQNVVLSVNLKTLNWPGSFTGGAGVDSALNAIRTGGGNILSDSSILATTDILNYGGGQTGGYFPTPFLDIGYVANASVSIQYQPTGVPVGQNILSIGDILGAPDILGSASSQFVTVYPLIATALTTGGDLYSLGDLYQAEYPNLYKASDYNWGAFQRFSPGTYQARALQFAMLLETVDPLTIAYDLELVITITIPSRIDTFSLSTSGSGTTAVVFNPTGAAAAAFNGGPATGNLPAVQGTIINAQAGDDLIITALSLSGLSVEVLNSGSPVVRAIILTVQGF